MRIAADLQLDKATLQQSRDQVADRIRAPAERRSFEGARQVLAEGHAASAQVLDEGDQGGVVAIQFRRTAGTTANQRQRVGRRRDVRDLTSQETLGELFDGIVRRLRIISVDTLTALTKEPGEGVGQALHRLVERELQAVRVDRRRPEGLGILPDQILFRPFLLMRDDLEIIPDLRTDLSGEAGQEALAAGDFIRQS